MIGAMDRPMVFSFADFSLDGFDNYGSRWTTEAADGWFSSPAIRSSSESRSGQDGEWESKPLRSARLIRFAGKVRATGSLEDLERSLRAFSALPMLGVVSGESAAFTLSGAAQIEDAPDSTIVSPLVATWQVTLKLPDPLLYGPAVSLSAGPSSSQASTGRTWPRTWPRSWGTVTSAAPDAARAPNIGTAPYWPTLRVNGPVDNGFTITVDETGDSLTYTGALLAGQWLDIDCRNRRVLINGNLSHLYKVTYTGRWLAVPIGGASFSLSVSGAGAGTSLELSGYEGAYI